MYLYKIYGMIVESDIELREAYECRESAYAQVSIRYADMQEEIERIEETIRTERAEWSEDGQEWSVCEINRNRSMLYYHTIGLFVISDGNLIEYTPVMDVHSPMFHQWILNMALAIIKVEKEEIILHGSGLMLPDRNQAFLISGDSGSGKSTLADYLLKRNCRFITDDVAALSYEEDGIYIEGAYPTRRLCLNVVEQQKLKKDELTYINDGEREKYILSMKDAYWGAIPRPLKAIFILTLNHDGEEVELIEHQGSGKLQWISNNLYRKRSYQQMGVTPKVFSQCLRIARDIPVYELRRPLHTQTVEQLADMIFHLMDGIK